MLTKGDDYPIHQTPEPVAFAGTDRNFYDRYFFNGYSRDSESFFAAALGVYPHINIIDAHFCVIHDGIQHNIHASRILNMERMDTHVGPISVEVIEPLKSLMVRVDENEYGIKGEIKFDCRAKVIKEPRFIHRLGPRAVMDYTRLTQNGSYSGWLEVKGDRVEITNDKYVGTRDRSWGIRPIGVQDPQPVLPETLPQFYWLWAPLNFDDCITLYDINDDPVGKPWHESGVIAPLGDAEPEAMASARSKIVFKSGTRHAKSAELFFQTEEGKDIKISIDPQYNFYMSGLGYVNPEWGHGIYKGDNVSAYDSIVLSDADPTSPMNLHIQAISKALMVDADGNEKQGIGVFEQLILGPHAPSGFNELFDMAP
jgi:hypothetical protein